MTLRDYYRSLTPHEKRRFFTQCIKHCRVGIPTVRAWINRETGTKSHRNPLPVYRPILAKITGIDEKKLFPNN